MRCIFIIVLILALISAYSFFKLESQPVVYEKDPTVKLMGISWKENQAIAVINNLVLKEGEVIDGYQITNIKKDRVILLRNNHEFELNLNGLIKRTIVVRIKNWLQGLQRY